MLRSGTFHEYFGHLFFPYLQDFNYLSSNDFEITLELGCDKYPPASALQGEWEDNKRALLEFIWLVSAPANQKTPFSHMTPFPVLIGRLYQAS